MQISQYPADATELTCKVRTWTRHPSNRHRKDMHSIDACISQTWCTMDCLIRINWFSQAIFLNLMVS